MPPNARRAYCTRQGDTQQESKAKATPTLKQIEHDK